MPGPSYHARTHLPDGTDPLEAFNSGVPSYPDFVLAQPSLWAYWPLNDASGTPIDVFGGRALTVHGGTFSYQQTGPFPDLPAQSALGFSGASNWLSYDLTVGEQTLWASTLPWTWMGWVYYTGTFPRAIFSLHNLVGGGGAAQSSVYTFTTEHLRLVRAASDVDSGDVLTTSTWHPVAVTYAGSATGVMNLYLDGALIGTLTNTSTNGVAQVRLGAQGNVGVEGNFWQGRQAQVAMFTSALSADDIADASSRTSGAAESGQVPTADGAGSYTWEFPTIEVTY